MGMLDFDLKGVVALAEEAGRATLTCYQKPLEIRYKGDESPVSQADELSHQIIAKGLADTGLQVVSEEGQTQSKATRYWCVDPLDGTKSFIAGVEDFTVNIALIVEGRPVWVWWWRQSSRWLGLVDWRVAVGEKRKDNPKDTVHTAPRTLAGIGQPKPFKRRHPELYETLGSRAGAARQ